jgi:penicillin-binding protein 1C
MGLGPRASRLGQQPDGSAMTTGAFIMSAAGRAARGLRAAWRLLRWPLVIGALLCTAAVQALLVAVLGFPIDRAALAADGATLVITDRDGALLARVPAPGGAPDRDHWVALADLPPVAVSAVIESEDRGFWDHRGVDGRAVVRAAWLDLRAGAPRYGASTITMQLARLVGSGDAPRSWRKKLRETVTALRIERALGKREILEQWFNRAYFGNGAWGLDAAARLYFGKPARALSTGEAVLLACLPRAPTAYDPITHPDAAVARRDRVLDAMVRHRRLSADEAARAKAQPLAFALHRPPARAPHFVRAVIDGLPPAIARKGGVVRTTLEWPLQETLERRVREQIATLTGKNVDQAGMVVLDTETATVRAWIGSVDWDGPAGQVDAVTRRRNPGSALKPFVYGAAIEAGDLPSTVAHDVRDVSPDYVVRQAGREHGPVRYREALGSSYNFAAVQALERAGVTRVMTALRAAGVATLPGTPDDYGPRLALGAAKVRLLDVAAGYRFAVTGGKVRAPTLVIAVEAPDRTRWRPALAPERRVFSPSTSWLVMDMMADAEARRPGFGQELPFDLPFPVAAKTGTARGFADMLAVAATREVLVAAWAGNFDGTPGQGVPGMEAAAPLVRDALLAVAGGRALTLPARPDDVEAIEVCAVSGMAPGPHCPVARDWAPRGHPPGHACDWHRLDGGAVRIIYPPALRGWLERTGGRRPRH